MQQLTQQLKSGKMEILEVPFPALNKGTIMVRNHYSVISAGTEGKTVTDARKGYIAKAKSRKKEVQQVIESVQDNGLVETYQRVMGKLEAPATLGYSCAGEVIEVGEDVNNFKVGDLVSCGGAGANHAEIVAVVENLCVKVPDSVDLKYAAFSTIASIAIQGIRQSGLRFGENSVVIGLGLIGQITMKVLEGSGIRSLGVDIDESQIKLAQDAGIKRVFNRNNRNIKDIINEFSSGYGVDSVIITAATSSTDPINFAGAIARKKGNVVVVGVVPTGFSRENYYKKELDLRMSTSYGPGRYDTNYEEKGIDYPIGYVRWTENRNMQAFIKMLEESKVDIEPLIAHVFAFKDAAKAYNLIVDNTEPYLGIVLKYDTENVSVAEKVKLNSNNYARSDVKVGLVGAGSFAQNYILPNLKGSVNLQGILTGSGSNAKHIGKKYGFQYATSNFEDLLIDDDLNTIFIATRHHLHAEYVLKSLEAGKNVFVEKPLAMNKEELGEIKEAYENVIKNTRETPRLMVGFNRRFAPQVKKMKINFSDEIPKAINYRINAGSLPVDHWVHDPDIGGGRIIGEGCHFIDLCTFIAGTEIETISAISMKTPENLHDTLAINLDFIDGSIASIYYFSNGNKKIPKEHLEVYQSGRTAILNDFKYLEIYGEKKKKDKLRKQDKGHAEEIQAFVNSITDGKSSPISFRELYHSSLATLKVIEAIKTKNSISFK